MTCLSRVMYLRTNCCLIHYGFVDSQQPENCENRNDPDLVQAFLKKWWVESDLNIKRKNDSVTNDGFQRYF